ncbi:uncharacterized protein [Ptychodera flava]
MVINSIPVEHKGKILNLRLHGNKIEELPHTSLGNFTALQALDLSDNLIRNLANNSFSSLHNLMSLNLSYNHLTSLPDGFVEKCPFLESIDLSGNKFSTFSASTFRGLFSLFELNLDDNRIRHLQHGVFDAAPNVLYLSLTFNKLRDLPVEAVRTLPNLHELDVSFNRIRKLSSHVSGLTNVAVLSMAGNEISDISQDAFDGLVNMSVIDLDGNKLQTLEQGALRQFSHLNYGDITFYSNPLICDCKAEALVHWMKEHSNKTSPFPIPTCVWPYHLNGVALNKVGDKDLTCANYETVKCSTSSPETAEQCSSLRSDKCVVTAIANRYQDTENCLCRSKGSCYVCPAGSYGDYSMKEGSCSSCPIFSTSGFGSMDLDQCVCIDGYAPNSSGGNCTACPRGYFKNSVGQGGCTPCKNGKAIFSGSTVCSCYPGYTLNSNYTCSACPENTFKVVQGSGECLACPSLSESREASGSVYDCMCTVANMEMRIIGGAAKCVVTGAEKDRPEKSSIMYLLFISLGLVALIAISAGVVTVISRRCFHSSDMTTMGSSSTCNTYVDERSVSEIQMKETDNKTPANSLDDSDGIFMQDPNYVKWEFPRKDLDLVGVVGQGAFGQVLEAKAYHLPGKSQPSKVAVKTLKKNAMSEEREALKTELDQLIYVGYHPNIINLLGASTSNGNLMIIMEYAEYGNLQSFLKSRCCVTEYLDNMESSDTSPLSEADLFSFAWQIARGMSHLASVKCVHRDLAARNVLVSEDMVAKLSDFGLAREIYESGYYFKESKGRLPYKWMAPEAIMFGQYTTKSDIWSYGVLLWEIVTLGGTPYPGVPVEQMLPLLESGYRMSKPPNCKQEIYDIMLTCWNKKPSKRPTAEELYQTFDKILQSTANQEYMEVQPDMVTMIHIGDEMGSQSSQQPLLISESDVQGVTVALGKDDNHANDLDLVTNRKDRTAPSSPNLSLVKQVYTQTPRLLERKEAPQPMSDTHLKIGNMMEYSNSCSEGNQQCSDMISHSLCVVDVQ